MVSIDNTSYCYMHIRADCIEYIKIIQMTYTNNFN